MAVVARRRRFAGFGDVSPGLQKVYNQLATLDYAYASLFPHVDFAKYDATIGGTPATIGDLVHSGEISLAEYEAAFGPIPSMSDPNIKAQYNAMVADTQRGIASGQYTPDSLSSLTPDFYIDHYTPFGTSIAAKAGGYHTTATGGTEFVDSHNQAVADAYIPPPAPVTTPTGPSRYIEDGIEFLDDGTILSVNGVKVTGQHLTPEEQDRLMHGGTLTPDEHAAIAPPPPAQSPPTSPPPSAPVTNGVTPSDQFANANGGSSGSPVYAGGGPSYFPASDGSGSAPVAVSSSLLDGISPLMLGGLALLGVVLVSRRRR